MFENIRAAHDQWKRTRQRIDDERAYYDNVWLGVETLMVDDLSAKPLKFPRGLDLDSLTPMMLLAAERIGYLLPVNLLTETQLRGIEDLRAKVDQNDREAVEEFLCALRDVQVREMVSKGIGKQALLDAGADPRILEHPGLDD